MKCPHCGAFVPQGDLFCGECGRSTAVAPSPPPLTLPDVPATPPPVYEPTVPVSPPITPPPAPRRNWTWLIVVIILVIVCVVCGGGGAAAVLLWSTPTPTSTLTPTPTFTPSPTLTPTITPTPTRTPKIISMVFASQTDMAGRPVGAATVFEAGTASIYCLFDFEGMAGVQDYRAVVYLNGQEYHTETLSPNGQDSGSDWFGWQDPSGLPAGEYTVEIWLQNNRLARSSLTVLGATAQDGGILLQDDFNDSASGWSTEDLETGLRWYGDGQMNIYVEKAGWTIYSIYGNKSNSFDNFAIRVEAKILQLPNQGAEYGLIVRVIGENYYQFVVSSSGSAKIRKHTADGWTTLSDWTRSDAIHAGADETNYLTVECQGAQMRFYVNDTLVAQANDSSFSSGQIGLSAGTYQDGGEALIVFDNVIVSKLP